ncbi:hypothetical protein CASFOL_006574 [Castilleja foliolosa]|uniref:HIT-type domain-containing protein n=1 Tax=Castilleja foliolosa TaxID=1961234 RepID=A0ABD3EAP4_9LAMI
MSDNILISEESSKSAVFNSNTRVICRVCEKQFSQYTCPRCNVRYCSLHCYKSHSLRCTESFMRDNVMGELQKIQPDEENKLKMLDILKRFHEEDEADSLDEDGTDTDSSFSEGTIQKILSDTQISLADLSINEKKQFQRAIASGELSKSIQPWDPWWLKPSAKHISLSPDGTQLVLPISNDESENLKWDDIPRGPETPVPPVSKLTSSNPSPILPIHLIDVIYSYCFTLHLYNGDWKTDPLEASMVVLSISSVLGQQQQQQPETVLEALLRCLEQTCSNSYKHAGGLRFGLRVIDDVIGLLCLGGNTLVCLLCDVQRLLGMGEREAKAERIGKTRSKLSFAERKVYFLMCWVHEQGGEVWGPLAGIVETEKVRVAEYAGGKTGSGVRMEGKVEVRGKDMIKEVI